MVKTVAKNKIILESEDWDRINSMCAIQCTGEEIAQVMGFSYDTLERRIKEVHDVSGAEYIKAHSQGGKATLRRAQWKAAMGGSNSMLIWLGKQYLGQKDQVQADTRTDLSVITDQQLDSKIQKLLKEDDPGK